MLNLGSASILFFILSVHISISRKMSRLTLYIALALAAMEISSVCGFLSIFPVRLNRCSDVAVLQVKRRLGRRIFGRQTLRMVSSCINENTLESWSLLHSAAMNGNLDEAELLIKAGCDLNARTILGQTPLHIAVKHKHIAMTEVLLQSGAATDAQDNEGLQPLHHAVKGSPELVLSLLAYGAPVDEVSTRGFTPLDIAIAAEAPTICIEALLYVDAAITAEGTLEEMLMAHRASADARLLLQTRHGKGKDGTVEARAAAYSKALFPPAMAAPFPALAGTDCSVEARAAAYEAAARAFRDGGDGGGGQARVATLLRLGAVQANLRSVRLATPQDKHTAARETFSLTWRLQAPGCEQAEYVARKMSVALSGSAEQGDDEGNYGNIEGNIKAVRGLEDLCVNLEEPGGLEKAVAMWEEQGVVVFPALLERALVEMLRAHVLAVCETSTRPLRRRFEPQLPQREPPDAGGGDDDDPQMDEYSKYKNIFSGAMDQSMNIRNPAFRTLRTIRPADRPEALQAIAEKLGPYLDAALQDSSHVLLEHAAYRIQPGASEQKWHLDDSVINRRTASLQVSLVHTAAEQGAFQVQPGTHRRSTLESYLLWAYPTPPFPPQIPIAVPAGTVMCYSPNVVHRGSGNTHDEERLVLALTLMGKHGSNPTPNGIPLAIHPDDKQQWCLAQGKLKRAGD